VAIQLTGIFAHYLAQARIRHGRPDDHRHLICHFFTVCQRRFLGG
jgi:hypothetical protein